MSDEQAKMMLEQMDRIADALEILSGLAEAETHVLVRDGEKRKVTMPALYWWLSEISDSIDCHT